MRYFYGLTLIATLFATPAAASEGGAEAYPNGADTQRVAVLPPPGTYVLTYTTYYTADRINDASGDALPIPVKIDAEAQIARIAHVSSTKILGATWAQHVLVPLVNLRTKIGGHSDNRTGLGDIIVNPIILSWNVGKNSHIAAGIDTFIPIGEYRSTRQANLGRNYWTFQPIVTYSYYDPAGPELTVKVMYDLNTKNKATDYKTGETIHTDFSAGYNLDKLTLGVTGYYSKQVKDDRQNGAMVGPNGNRGELFAVGPMLRYQLGHVPISAEWQHEFVAHNRSQGDRFWVKAAFRF
jgi:hypothetical protein